MAFGAKTVGNTYTTENNGTNGVSGKEIFFPSASGPDGQAMYYVFRVLPDLPDYEENGVVAKEYRGTVMVNGQKVFRSCIVGNDNPWDVENRKIKEDIESQEGMSDNEKAELLKSKKLQWVKKFFFTNVLNRETGTVQILKGSWEKHVWDDKLERWVPANREFGGGTVYAQFMDFVQTGVAVQNPESPKGKHLILKDPTKFDIKFVCKGKGQFGKNYSFREALYNSDNADLPEMYTLPRWDIEGWITGKGVWPYEALVELKEGQDYYKLVEKYQIQLYPTLRVTEQAEVQVNGASEDDDLFF